jgi:hypothetical protein
MRVSGSTQMNFKTPNPSKKHQGSDAHNSPVTDAHSLENSFHGRPSTQFKKIKSDVQNVTYLME